MIRCPQYGRMHPVLRRTIQEELNPLYHLECSNCGHSINTNDSLPPWCPYCQFPMNMYQRHWTGEPQPSCMR